LPDRRKERLIPATISFPTGKCQALTPGRSQHKLFVFGILPLLQGSIRMTKIIPPSLGWA
jgi:hypothetical protein